MASLTSTALHGFRWNYLTSAALLLGQLTFTAVTARLISPAEFGTFAVAATFMQFAGYFANAGLLGAVVRAPSLSTETMRTALSIAISGGLVVGAFLTLSRHLLASMVGNPDASRVLAFLAWQPFLMALAAVPVGRLRRDLRFRAGAVSEAVAQIVGFAVGLSLAARGVGELSLAAVPLTAAALTLLVTTAIARTPLVPHFSLTGARDLLSFSSQVTIQNVLHYSAYAAPAWAVSRFAGASSLGYFSRANNLANVPLQQLTVGVTRTLYPMYVALRGDATRLRRAIDEALAASSLVSFLLFGALAGAAHPIVLLLLGGRWAPTESLLVLFSLFAALNLIYTVLASAAEALSLMRPIWSGQFLLLGALTIGLGSGAWIGIGTRGFVAVAVVGQLVSLIPHLGWVARLGERHWVGDLGRLTLHLAVGLVLFFILRIVAWSAPNLNALTSMGIMSGISLSYSIVVWRFGKMIPGVAVIRSRVAMRDGTTA